VDGSAVHAFNDILKRGASAAVRWTRGRRTRRV